jgi:hypothetical protein
MQYAEAEGAEGGGGPGEERAGVAEARQGGAYRQRVTRRWNGADPAPEAEASPTRPSASEGAWRRISTAPTSARSGGVADATERQRGSLEAHKHSARSGGVADATERQRGSLEAHKHSEELGAA